MNDELEALRWNGQRFLTLDKLGTTTSLTRTDTERGKTRRVCDTCYMTASGKCDKIPGKNYCYNNRKYGREVMTWSQGAPSASNHEATWGQLIQRGDRKGMEIRKALFDQPPEDPLDEPATIGDDPNFQTLPTSLIRNEQKRLYVLMEEEDDMEVTGE